MQTKAQHWIAVGSIWALIGVALGAFGAHALRETLAASDQLANWRTGVQYQVWHAMALILFGLYRMQRPGNSKIGRVLLSGSALFSGSIYLLALDIGTAGVWPFTPIGGVLLMAGWAMFAIEAWRAENSSRS